jgi:hypothetical protein
MYRFNSGDISRPALALALTASMVATACEAQRPDNAQVSGAPVVSTSPIPIRPAVEGDQECATDVAAALDLLEQKDSKSYVFVLGHIGVIECVVQGSGMAAYETPPRFLLGDQTREEGSIWLAGSLVHDAKHSDQYGDYRKTHPMEQDVPDSAWKGREAEEACINLQIEALKSIGADQQTIEYLEIVARTEYWNDPTRTW